MLSPNLEEVRIALGTLDDLVHSVVFYFHALIARGFGDGAPGVFM